jgi:hypothetical protein
VGPNDPPQKHYVLDVLCRVAPGTEIGKPSSDAAKAARPDAKGEVAIIGVTMDTVQSIAHIRLKMPNDLRARQQKEQAYKLVDEVKRRFKDGITLLDPVSNQGIKDEGFRKLVRKIKVLEDRVGSLPIAEDPALPALFDEYDRKAALGTKVRELKKRISSVQDVLQLEELKSRKRVLRRLGFVEGEVATVKGRVACELSTGDELLLTELMFGGTFNDLAPEALTALLSCFVFDEKVSTLEWRELTPVRGQDAAHRRHRRPPPHAAGDGAAHRAGLERVQAPPRGRRVRAELQGRARAARARVVQGRTVLRDRQDDGHLRGVHHPLAAPPARAPPAARERRQRDRQRRPRGQVYKVHRDYRAHQLGRVQPFALPVDDCMHCADEGGKAVWHVVG